MLIEQSDIRQQAKRFWTDDTELVAMHEQNALYRELYLAPLYQIVQNELRPDDFPADGFVLEVGCGTNYFASHLAPDWLRPRLVSMDINHPSLSVGKRQDPRARLAQTDANLMGFAPDSFVGVVGLSSFDSLPDLSRVLKEVNRVTQPGSPVWLGQDAVVPLYAPLGFPPNAYSVDQYHRALTHAFYTGLLPVEREGDVEAIAVVPRAELLERVQADDDISDIAARAFVTGSDRGVLDECYSWDELEQFQQMYGIQEDLSPFVGEDMVVQWARIKVLQARTTKERNIFKSLIRSVS